MKIKIIAIALAALAVFSLAGCQATPDQEFIAQKDTERMIEQARDDAHGTKLRDMQLPSGNYTYTASGVDGRLAISVDAPVSVPTAGVPTARVAGAGFSQDAVRGMVSYLFPGEQPMTRADGGVMTKSQIEERILELKKQLAEKSYDTNVYTDENIQNQIADLETEYQIAPEVVAESVSCPTDGTMELVDSNKGDGDQMYLLDAYTENASIYVISLATPESGTADSLLEYTGPRGYDYAQTRTISADGGALPGEAQGRLTMSLEQAKKLCEGFLAAGGVSDMALGDVCVASDQKTDSAGEASPAQNYAWQLSYTRVVNGVQVAIDGTRGASSGDENMLPWSSESLVISVDNDGIQRVLWFAPTTTGEILTPDTGLIGFANAMDIFEKMISIVYEPQAPADSKDIKDASISVCIDSIELCLIRVREQNAGGRNGVYVPAWVFYGSVKSSRTHISDGSYTRTEDTGARKYAVLVVNAIDGSIIDPARGY